MNLQKRSELGRLKERYFSHRGIKLTRTIRELIKLIGANKAANYLQEWSIEKRTKWYNQNKNRLKELSEKPNLKKIYEAVMLTCLQNKPDEVPIIEELDKRIVWETRSPCPVLEACKALGIDTRKFCANAYEKPAQVIFELINPRIKFGRNYERIRPYANGCEEYIEIS